MGACSSGAPSSNISGQEACFSTDAIVSSPPKRIPLTQGQFAIVDDADFDELSQVKWCAQWNPDTHSFYAVRKIRLPDGKWTTERMARRILGLERGDKREADHINHMTLDNRRSNLRIVTNQENNQNRKAKGYSWHKRCKKYEARIVLDGNLKHLGSFNTPAEARAAYLAAKRIYHPSAPVMEATR